MNTGTMGVNSLPKTVNRQRRGCDVNRGPTACESSTLTTRLHTAEELRQLLCDYLSAAMCRLCAYGPADATASQNPVISCLIQIQTNFIFLVPAYPGFSGNETNKRV